jgi:hypothetical protein
MTSNPLTMKQLDYYDVSKLEQPNIKNYMTTYFYDKGELIATIPPGTTLDVILNDNDIKIPSTAVKQQILDKEKYDLDMKKYKDEIAKLNLEFGQDLFREFNVEDNPKRNRCYSLAFNFGHQYGVVGVYECFEKLVSLIKD